MKTERKIDLMCYENQCISNGNKYIAGIDEVGRGPLAGPVVCCAIIMDLNKPIEGVNDSKKLSEKKREELYDLILNNSIAYSISSEDSDVIDKINILNATKISMKKAVEKLSVMPDIVLVDALKLDISIPTIPIIHGDALSYTIACASIIAKVFRDRLMVEFDKKYPEYNFCKHKGYGTRAHIEAIQKFGICEIHRKTFVKNFVGEVSD